MPFVTVYQKPEFPPLLPIGRHRMTLDAIRQLCVDAFSTRSSTREGIMCGLEFVVSVLRQAGIVGELWVDGSFLTEKIDPDDADIVLYLSGAFADNATPDQRNCIEWFRDDRSAIHGCARCHCFPITRWPDGHANFWVGEYNYAYWMKQWGFSRSDEIKGIAVVELT